jgi:hypothetical protein
MSDDGAEMGVKADRALATVLGGAEQPATEEKMTVEQQRDWLLTAPRCTDPDAMLDYGECARSVAGEILRWALANPRRYATTPPETTYAYDTDESGERLWSTGRPTTLGLYDVLKEEGVALDTLGITGFQWGWAYNAARRCLELPSVPNPAIVTMGGEA